MKCLCCRVCIAYGVMNCVLKMLRSETWSGKLVNRARAASLVHEKCQLTGDS